MAQADREEARSLRRFLSFSQLQRAVRDAQRIDEARQRLELRLRLDWAGYRSVA